MHTRKTMQKGTRDAARCILRHASHARVFNVFVCVVDVWKYMHTSTHHTCTIRSLLSIVEQRHTRQMRKRKRVRTWGLACLRIELFCARRTNACIAANLARHTRARRSAAQPPPVERDDAHSTTACPIANRAAPAVASARGFFSFVGWFVRFSRFSGVSVRNIYFRVPLQQWHSGPFVVAGRRFATLPRRRAKDLKPLPALPCIASAPSVPF